MKRDRNLTLPILILSTVVLLFGGAAVMAGDYHSGATLVCNECHNMHFSQTHGYADDGSGITVPLGSAGPYTYLLRDDVNALCLNCHDNNFAPDVFELNNGTNIRTAGALNRDNIAPYYDTVGHTLDSNTAAPGGSWTPPHGVFQCTDCHQPHGYGGPTANPYRNLSGTITAFNGSVTYEIDALFTNATNTVDVIETQAAIYDQEEVNYQEPVPVFGAPGYAAWCGECHTNFHGTSGGSPIGGSGTPPEGFDRHPVTGEVDIGAVGGGHSSIDVYWGWDSGTSMDTGKVNFVKATSPTATWPVNGTLATGAGPIDMSPTCVSCHKPHGNQNSFGLIYMTNTGAVTEEGTALGVYEDLCKQCHVQGG